jgi:hypothetical protein
LRGKKETGSGVLGLLGSYLYSRFNTDLFIFKHERIKLYEEIAVMFI